MKKIITCTFFVLLWSSFVFAQNPQSSDGYNKIEIFTGYSANNLTSGNPEGLVNPNSNKTPTYRGWNTSINYNVKRFVGIKGDVSGHYKNYDISNLPNFLRANASIYSYTAGFQIKDNRKSKRFSPFVHAMAGVTTSKVKIRLADFPPVSEETNSGFTMIIGGGIDVKVNKRFSIRLIQADYNPTFISGSRQNNVRLGFG
jgi:Outer membrane protein beta-barrel domain